MKEKLKNNKPKLTKMLMMAFSLFCAMLLWVYVTSTEGDEITQLYSGVRVVYEGESTMRESRGLVRTDGGNATIRVSMTGSRRILTKFAASDLTAVIDLSTITSAGTYTSSCNINFPSGIDRSAITVNSKSPENITFVIDKLSTAAVEVKGVFNGSAAEGFSAEPLEFSPNSVRISGPQNAIEKVAYAWVEVGRENVDKTLTFESDYKLFDKDGNEIKDESISLESNTVTVTLPIIAIKEVELTLNLIDGGGATADNAIATIEPSSITLSGDADTLAGINSIQLATIDLASVGDSVSDTVTIVIPNDTEILSGPREASYKVQIKGLDTKRVNVTNISYTNLTEGFTAEIMSDSISVDIRGPQSVLKEISDVNVRAVADLSDYGTATGILSVPVKISIDGTTEAGALDGDYKIYINVSAGQP